MAADFTIDELRRIQRTLHRRFHITGRHDILDVGFGPGYRSNLRDPARPWCICFYVSRKRRAPHFSRIPREVRFRLKRGRRFFTFRCATDVIELTGAVPTGRRIEPGGRSVAGAMVAWKPRGAARLQWALVSVAHGIPVDGETEWMGLQVTVDGAGSSTLPAALLARSSKASHVDASLLGVDRFDLVRCQLLRQHQKTSGRPVRSLEELKGSVGSTGSTRPFDLDWPFEVRAYLPRTRLFQPHLGIVDHVLHAHRATAGTFAPGSSGSLWKVRGVAAALQFGGLAPRYEEGFAQAFTEILHWSEQRLAARQAIEAGSFRFVSGC